MAPKEALKCSRQIIPIYESPIIFIYIIPTLKSCISSKVLQLRDMPQGIKSNKQNKGEKMYTHIQHRAPQPLGLSHAGGGRDNPAALLTPSTSSRVCACAQRWIHALAMAGARVWHCSVSLHSASPGFFHKYEIGSSCVPRNAIMKPTVWLVLWGVCSSFRRQLIGHRAVGCALYLCSRGLDSCWYSHVTDVAFCCRGAVLEIRAMTGQGPAPRMLMLLKGLNSKKSSSLLWKTSCFWKADYSEVWILETDFLPSEMLPCLCLGTKLYESCLVEPEFWNSGSWVKSILASIKVRKENRINFQL